MDDSSSAAAGITAAAPAVRRPLWVWIICLVCLLAVLNIWLSLVMIAAQLLPLPVNHAAFYAALQGIEWLLLGLPSVLMCVAVVQLFRLRREALQWWLAALLVGPLVDLYFWMATDWPRTVGLLDQIGMGVAVLTKAAIVAYCVRLQRRGVLK